MKISKNHIINKVFLEVNTSSKEKAYYIKDHLDVFLKDQVFPLLEERFDTLEHKISGKSIQIQKLNLDIDIKERLDFDEIKDQIVRNTYMGIEKTINASSYSSKKNSTVLNLEQSDLKALFFFLEKGTVPWYKDNEELHFLSDLDTLEEIMQSSDFERGFIDRLSIPVIRKRLIYQFPDVFISRMLHKAFLNTIDVKDRIWTAWVKAILNDKILQIIQQQNKDNRFKIWEAILLGLRTKDITAFQKEAQSIRVVDKKGEITNLIDLIGASTKNTQFKISIDKSDDPKDSQSSVLNDEKSKDKVSSPKNHQEKIENIDAKDVEIKNDFDDAIPIESEEEKSASIEDDISILEKDLDVIEEVDYYMDNAGLILVHPFLKQFFESCELLKENGEFEDPELAVHLLHYMATKQEQQPENRMVFEKFICNIPIHQPISRNIVINDDHKDKIEELLEAVIEHWGALQSASPDLLRHEFLQRSGKLILKGKSPKIILERKTQDILIDRLPWNLSLIKLPWHNQLIFVDW